MHVTFPICVCLRGMHAGQSDYDRYSNCEQRMFEWDSSVDAQRGSVGFLNILECIQI